MKDNFSRVSDKYARFRPAYPAALIEALLDAVPGRSAVWDCGTGSGQFALALSPHFETVVATDASAEQLRHAVPRPNIRYAVGHAESCDAPDGAFDLVSAAQSLHWFDAEAFFREVARVLKPGGRFAAAGYSLCSIGPDLDPVLGRFYHGVVGPYWDAERRAVDEHYRSIPFPFHEIPTPEFSASYHWTLEEFAGYVRTWSAVGHFLKARGADPVPELVSLIGNRWPAGAVREVRFPFFLRIGASGASDAAS